MKVSELTLFKINTIHHKTLHTHCRMKCKVCSTNPPQYNFLFKESLPSVLKWSRSSIETHATITTLFLINIKLLQLFSFLFNELKMEMSQKLKQFYLITRPYSDFYSTFIHLLQIVNHASELIVEHFFVSLINYPFTSTMLSRSYYRSC